MSQHLWRLRIAGGEFPVRLSNAAWLPQLGRRLHEHCYPAGKKKNGTRPFFSPFDLHFLSYSTALFCSRQLQLGCDGVCRDFRYFAGNDTPMVSYTYIHMTRYLTKIGSIMECTFSFLFRDETRTHSIKISPACGVGIEKEKRKMA